MMDINAFKFNSGLIDTKICMLSNGGGIELHTRVGFEG